MWKIVSFREVQRAWKTQLSRILQARQGLWHLSVDAWLEYEQCLVMAVRQEDGQSLHCQLPMHKLRGFQEPEKESVKVLPAQWGVKVHHKPQVQVQRCLGAWIYVLYTKISTDYCHVSRIKQVYQVPQSSCPRLTSSCSPHRETWLGEVLLSTEG